MNNADKVVDLFPAQLNCSQSVLTVFGAQYGLDADLAVKLGRPLGGGIGHTGKTCGAVTAAILILGLAKDHPDEKEARKVSFSNAKEFFRRFEDLHKSTECKILLGADMSTEEGLKKIQEEKLVPKMCPKFVKDAATILEKLLAS